MPDPTPTREELEVAQAIDCRHVAMRAVCTDCLARALAARRSPLTEADVEAMLRAMHETYDCNPLTRNQIMAVTRAVLARLGGKEADKTRQRDALAQALERLLEEYATTNIRQRLCDTNLPFYFAQARQHKKEA